LTRESAIIGRPRFVEKQFATLLAVLLLSVACGSEPPIPTADGPALAAAREKMIEETFPARGIDSTIVYAAFRRVPRAAFLPPDLRPRAWEDRAFARPDGETITAPFLSAAMLQSLSVEKGSRVLECGTRSGWFTALLAATGASVTTVAPRVTTIEGARRRIDALGLRGVTFRIGDPLSAPDGEFDAIVVNGAVRHIPRALYARLAPGGRILAPIGEPTEVQTLVLAVRGQGEPRSTRALLPVRFGALRRVP
jgi:protein-L-isoaspartate(D-aspartate) O-methyltransferase